MKNAGFAIHGSTSGNNKEVTGIFNSLTNLSWYADGKDVLGVVLEESEWVILVERKTVSNKKTIIIFMKNF